MIGIVDYGMGNLHSVTKGLERIGCQSFVSDDPAKLMKADRIILPGVGSFRDGMVELRVRGLDEFLQEWARGGGMLLGICLGMQLLFEESEENGPTDGLAILPGKVIRFPGKTAEGSNYKVPHMGWNRLSFQQPEHAVLQDVSTGHVYFVHSYVVQTATEDVLIASSDYGGMLVPAVVGRGNVWGTQFHPEKSSVLGMKMLQNFAGEKGDVV